MKYSSILSYCSFCLVIIVLATSCSVSKKISKQAAAALLKDSAILPAHMGISVFEPATGKYWYNHNAEKYFIPASNTKLFSLYAGMKYLGDSLVGLRYSVYDSSNIIIKPSGDPTFLLAEYEKQNLYDFLKSTSKNIHVSKEHSLNYYKPFGKGWQIDDVSESYQVPRSEFPIYGNLASFMVQPDSSILVIPKIFNHPNNLYVSGKMPKISAGKKADVFENRFLIFTNTEGASKLQIPFRPTSGLVYIEILGDTLKKQIKTDGSMLNPKWLPVYSQPSDSLFKPMMHRSDNFFAEQTLLMASNEKLGYMNDADMIAYILQNDLAAIPQKPQWVDGSGLSRYNLFTPQSFVYLLNKLKNDFGLARLQNILATGGEGTLRAYYLPESGFIWAKTGTLSNNCALSGYLITKKGKLLIFSVLANNYPTAATPVRKAVEKFLQKLRNDL